MAATLAGLERRFDVAAVTAAPGEAGPAARAVRGAVPPRLRGLRRDLLFVAQDRAFGRRALAEARAFRPDLVYERSEYFATAGLRLSRALGVPLVLEVNGLLEQDARTMYRSLAEPVGARLERVKHRRADAVVTVSPGLARRLAERGADPAKTVVIPNTIDPARVVAEPPPARPGCATIGWVGHLMPWHRDALDLLVDVAPAVLDADAEVDFAIVGGGPGLEELAARVDAAGLAERFRFTGLLPQAEVPAEVRRFDVGVIPAVFDYAFPVKLVEMGAAGVAVVAPRSADLDRLVEPGVEYEPFEPDDPRSLAAALRGLAGDAERRGRLGAALHRAVRERFTWDASGDALAGLVERVLADARR